jgi:hypothetical protein
VREGDHVEREEGQPHERRMLARGPVLGKGR